MKQNYDIAANIWPAYTGKEKTMKKSEIGVYYWSNWHPTRQNSIKRGEGWTEWEYTKRAIPRFVGHQQPRIPIWGYLDDSKIKVVTNQIQVAHDYGIDGFIFDYVVDHENAHEEIKAFLNAPNSKLLKFCFMECGQVPENFDAHFEYIINNFFAKENYWRIDGGLYYSIYEINKYIDAAGSVERLAEIFERFREKTREAGLGEINLVGIEWGLQARKLKDSPYETAKRLGLNGISSYTWAHNGLPSWPTGSYREWAEIGYRAMDEIDAMFDIPYYFHVSAGWDCSPRCPENMIFQEGGPLMYHTLWGEYEIVEKQYFSTIITDDSPEEFKTALWKIMKKSEEKGRSFVSINAWNEWTEGSYLEPDSRYGYGKLEAIRDVCKT